VRTTSAVRAHDLGQRAKRNCPLPSTASRQERMRTGRRAPARRRRAGRFASARCGAFRGAGLRRAGS